MSDRWKITLRYLILIVVGSLLSFVPVSNSVTEKTLQVRSASSAGEYQEQAELLIQLAAENPWWKSLWESAGEAAA